MYKNVIKRLIDIFISLIALIVLSPVMLVLILSGAIVMQGNPFFIQMRPGMIDKKNGTEKIFHLIKFRTMSNKRDEKGDLLPDERRLNKYGRFLRSTSLDELPELFNILKGDMSLVGPRPLLVEYLPYYTREERFRHNVRPGLTGWAQVNGRNAISWDKKLALDLEYISDITFTKDFKIICQTFVKVFKRSDIQVGNTFTSGKFIDQRKARINAKSVEE